MLVFINTDSICTFQPFLGFFSPIQKESLKLCRTDTGIFPCRFINSSNNVIEDTVPFDGNVGVAKFTCGLLI